jgi:hypothetical protein
MIFVPHGCSWTLRADGYRAAPLADPGAFSIRYRERVRPLMHPFAVAAHHFPAVVPRGLTPVVTVEGEYGALVELDASIVLGMVFGDDFHSLIIGETNREKEYDRLRELVHELTVNEALLLGHRRRRYLYQPPAGWQSFVLNEMDAFFYAPDHPRTAGCLVVYAALPQPPGGDLTAELLEAHRGQIGDVQVGTSDAPVAFTTATGLSGWSVKAAASSGGAPLVCELACVADSAFAYPFCLFAAPTAARGAILRGVVDSLQPLAGPARPRAEVFAHWLR